ncbi:MAG: hypothetical protein MJ061_06580, partial [Mailhella sp.]|nr:hypothetical protein [Mailhella sp.]
MSEVEHRAGAAAFADGAEVAPGVVFDFSRRVRLGMPEAVFCQGKPEEALVGLMERFGRSSGHPVLFTRLEPGMFSAMPDHIRAEYDYHALSRTAWGVPLSTASSAAAPLGSAGRAEVAITGE